MIRNLSIIFIIVLLLCFLTACGESDTEWNQKTGETVNLTVLPEGVELVPFEKFKEGFAFVSNTNWESPPATLEEVQKAFGTNGVYYKNSDITEAGNTYKTYVWFSDEDWLDSKVAVAVNFKVDNETGELTYYSYASQGIVYTDVQ